MGVNRQTGGGRAWYPSGPRLDGSSSSSGGNVGIGIMKVSSGTSYQTDVRNPDPKNFTLVKVERVGDVFVSMIQYPNCTNYEGKKVLVTDFNPKMRNELDPHFVRNGGIIARFAPTNKGWEMAVKFANMIG